MKYKNLKKYIIENENNEDDLITLDICYRLSDQLKDFDDVYFKHIKEKYEIHMRFRVGTEKEIVEILNKLKIAKTLNIFEMKIITLEFLLNDNTPLKYNSYDTPIIDITLKELNKSLNYTKSERIEDYNKIIFLSFDNNLETLLKSFTKIELDIVFPNKNTIDNIEIYLNPNTLKDFDEFNDYLKSIKNNNIFKSSRIKSILFVFKEEPSEKFKGEEFLDYAKVLKELNESGSFELNSFELIEYNKSKAFRFRG